jgi:hypothetical protein
MAYRRLAAAVLALFACAAAASDQTGGAARSAPARADSAGTGDGATTLGPLVITPEEEEAYRLSRGLPCLGCGTASGKSSSGVLGAVEWIIDGFLPAEPAEPEVQERMVHDIKRENSGDARLP